MIGIYKITNLINNKIYIGLSTDIRRRWEQHRNRSRDLKYQTHLYCAIRKYGLQNFKFEVIEECDKDCLQEREKYWIAYYDSYNNGYNETLGGECGSPPEYDRTLIEKYWNDGYNIKSIAELLGCSPATVVVALKELNLYSIKEIKKRQYVSLSTPVFQYDLNGAFVKQFDSLHQAADSVQGQTQSIKKCCNRQYKYAYDSIWRFYKQPQLDLKKELATILCYDLKGDYVDSYSSMTEAEQITGVPRASIGAACRHKAHRGGRFQWRYADDETPLEIVPILYICQYDLNDNLLNTYDSISQASKATKISRRSISNAIKNKTVINNSKWRYVEDYGG